jgi:uncharacterized membrane protein YphA (DoxX/SURF4 family)
MKIDLTKYHFFSKVAIYTLGVVSILIGTYHLYQPNELLLFVPFFLPGGEIWSYMMGVSYFLVGVSFLFNYYVKFTSYLLALFLFLFVVSVHIPNYFFADSNDIRTFALFNILNNTAIGAFALHIGAGARNQKLHFEDND